MSKRQKRFELERLADVDDERGGTDQGHREQEGTRRLEDVGEVLEGRDDDPPSDLTVYRLVPA